MGWKVPNWTPKWLDRLWEWFGNEVEVVHSIQCERCGRMIPVPEDVTQEGVNRLIKAHESFFHAD